MGWKRRAAYVVVALLLINVGQAVLEENQQPEPEVTPSSETTDRTTDVTSSPNLEVKNLQNPEVEQIDRDVTQLGDGYEFTTTMQNSGEAGDIYVMLFVGPESPETLPDTRGELEDLGFELQRASTFYYDSDERRTITFTENDMEDLEAYAFYAFPGSYSATVENHGTSGVVDVSFVWKNASTGNRETVTTKSATIGEGDSMDVEFNVKEYPPFTSPEKNYTSWEIVAEPAG